MAGHSSQLAPPGLQSEKAPRRFRIYNPRPLGDKPRSLSPLMSSRRRPKFIGLFHDDVVTDSYWIREEGKLALPPLDGVKELALLGEVLPPDPAHPTATGELGLRVRLDGREVAATALPPGPFRLTVALPASDHADGHILALKLTGVTG